ncbi:MAG: ribosomal protein S18 acetylase RimI-like enzyme [Psychromonas sp.]
MAFVPIQGVLFYMSELNIRSAKVSDLDRCFEIENASYAGEEAATKEKVLKRIETYPEGFLILENKKEIVGFINSGATHKVELSDEEFKELIGHDPHGEHIVIMSVVIHPEYQGKSFTSLLMKHFINAMKEMNKTEIYLICQTELINMYAKYGFVYLGESDSDHGGLSWHEMSLSLSAQQIKSLDAFAVISK